MSASHLNKSPLLGNNLIEGESIPKEGTCSTEYRISDNIFGLLGGIFQAAQNQVRGVLTSFLKGGYKLQNQGHLFRTTVNELGKALFLEYSSKYTAIFLNPLYLSPRRLLLLPGSGSASFSEAQRPLLC